MHWQKPSISGPCAKGFGVGRVATEAGEQLLIDKRGDSTTVVGTVFLLQGLLRVSYWQ